MNKKSDRRIIIIIIILLIVTVSLSYLAIRIISKDVYFGAGIPMSRTHNLKDYNKMLKDFKEYKPFMPKLTDLGQYEDVYFSRNYQTIIVFDNTSYILKVKYKKKEFNRQKKKTYEKYTFIKKPIIFEDLKNPLKDYTKDNIRKIKIPTTFKINDGTIFKYVELEKNAIQDNGPKEVMLIGENDEDCIIYYIFYYDQDLDFYESNYEFMNDYVGPLD